MTCGEFQSIVTDLARSGLSAAEQREATIHARACEPCAKRLADEEGVTRALRQLREATTEQAPDWMEESLRQAFLSQEQQLAGRHARYMWGAAAAAAGLVTLGIIGLSWLRPGSDQAPPIAVERQNATPTSPSAAPPSTSAPVVDRNTRQSAVSTEDQVSPARVRRAPTSRARTPVEDEPREIVTDFVWLPYGAPSAFESGQIVRVRIPRSVLPSFGLAMDGRDLAERVQADIVVGEDGLARAIRLVHTQAGGEPFE